MIVVLGILTQVMCVVTIDCFSAGGGNYKRHDACQYLGENLSQIQTASRIQCASTCCKHENCTAFLFGAATSCQLIGDGYVIEQTTGCQYYHGKYQINNK